MINDKNLNKILLSFPKARPKLSSSLSSIYQDEYKRNRDGKSLASYLSQKLESWMHYKVANNVSLFGHRNLLTLEIGAGTLNHLPYEKGLGNYDVIEPMTFLYKESPLKKFVNNFYTDISELPSKKKYDRINSIAVLEHVEDLPKLIKDSTRLLNDEGVFSCGVPAEGGFLWGVSWRLTTGLEFRLRTGQDYAKIMQHEHINNVFEIEQLLNYFFEIVRVKTFGIGTHFSLYKYLECKYPRSMTK